MLSEKSRFEAKDGSGRFHTIIVAHSDSPDEASSDDLPAPAPEDQLFDLHCGPVKRLRKGEYQLFAGGEVLTTSDTSAP